MPIRRSTQDIFRFQLGELMLKRPLVKIYLPLFSIVLTAAIVNGCTNAPGNSHLRKRLSDSQKAALLKQNALDGASKPFFGKNPDPTDSGDDSASDPGKDPGTGEDSGKDVPAGGDDSSKDQPADPNGGDDGKGGDQPTDNGGDGKDQPAEPDTNTGGNPDPGKGEETPAEPTPPPPPPPPTTGDGLFPSVTLCSDIGTQKAGTNAKASSGISIKLYNMQAAMVYEQADLGVALAFKNETISSHSVKLSLPLSLGSEEMFAVLCDVSKHDSCIADLAFINRMKATTSPLMARELKPGMVGFVNGVKVVNSVVTAKKAIVLLEDNKTNDPGAPKKGKVEQADCDSIASPLVVDLKGRAVQLSSPAKGVKFDILGDGSKRQISWPVLPSTAFIALDRNKNGNIDSVAELFGNNTVGPDGQKAANGFEALKKYDLNKDNVIDEKDAVYSQLVLWFDLNRNGRAEPGELKGLRESSLLAIDLDYLHGFEVDQYGNQTRERSAAQFVGDVLRMVFDIWFKI